MASAVCTVNASATTSGVNVGAASTPTIALQSASGVRTWTLTCISTDETTNAATVNASLLVNQTTKTATFTAGGVGTACLFRSVVNGGVDANGAVDPSATTTFATFVLASSGNRVVPAGMSSEADPVNGWASILNPLLRTGASGGGGGGGSVPTGTGFVHITAGAQDVAARAVSLSGADVTGTLPLASVAAPTGTGVAKVSGGAWVSAAALVALASDVSGTLPLANMAAPTGTGIPHVVAGAWSGATSLVSLSTDVTGVLPLANMAAPTGTGFAKVTAGAWSAAASAQINLATEVSGTLSAGNMPNGAGDVSGAWTANVVSTITGTSGLVNIPATTLTFTSLTTATTITQTNQLAASTNGLALTIQAQGATSGTGGALNLSSGTGSIAAGLVNIQVGGTTRAKFDTLGITTSPAGTSACQTYVGAAPGFITSGGLWIGPNAAAPTISNYSIAGDGSGLNINCTSTLNISASSNVVVSAGGFLRYTVLSTGGVRFPNGTAYSLYGRNNAGSADVSMLCLESDDSVRIRGTVLVAAASGVAINGTGSFGSGVGVVSIANATTNPSTATTGGGVLYANAGALYWFSTTGTARLIATA